MPPLKPIPSALPNVSVAQRGTDAIISFGRIRQVMNVGTEQITLSSVEILVLAEVYPVISPETLAAALEPERRSRVRDARLARQSAEEQLERDRAA